MRKNIILTLIFTLLLAAPSLINAKEPVNYDTIKTLIDEGNVVELGNYLKQYPTELETILKTKITPNGFYFTEGWQENFCQVPLHYAAATGKQEIVDLFLDIAPDAIESEDPFNKATPLWCANFTNQERVVDSLYVRGANLAAQDKLGFDPLLITIDKGYINLMDYYMDNAVQFIYRDNNAYYKRVNGDTSLHVFFYHRYTYDEKAKNNRRNIFDRIMEKHAAEDKDLKTKDENGRTPLMYAVSKNERDYVIALKSYELDLRGNDDFVNIKDNDGNTACNYAVAYEDELKKENEEAKKELEAVTQQKQNSITDDMAPYDRRINTLNKTIANTETELGKNKDIQIMVCGTKQVLGIKKADIIRIQNRFKALVSEL